MFKRPQHKDTKKRKAQRIGCNNSTHLQKTQGQDQDIKVLNAPVNKKLKGFKYQLMIYCIFDDF